MTKPEAPATALAPPAKKTLAVFFSPDLCHHILEAQKLPWCYCVTTLTFKLYINSGDRR